MAAAYLMDARTSIAADARAAAEEGIQAANMALGDIEAALSLMGSVEIDVDTGAIIDVDLDGDVSGSVGAAAEAVTGASGAAVDATVGAAGSVQLDY